MSPRSSKRETIKHGTYRHITCNSKFVIYYQVCASCGIVSNIGKTNCLRKRMNVHISSCRLGNSNDVFDNHVFACKKDNKEPYFKLWVLMEVNDIKKLLVYENYFHKRGMDTLNKEKSKIWCVIKNHNSVQFIYRTIFYIILIALMMSKGSSAEEKFYYCAIFIYFNIF